MTNHKKLVFFYLAIVYIKNICIFVLDNIKYKIMKTDLKAIELIQLHGRCKNFNIRSTIISEDIRISTACIFYEGNFFGDYHQIETIVFNKKSSMKMKIHSTILHEKTVDYAIRFHEKLSYLYLNNI